MSLASDDTTQSVTDSEVAAFKQTLRSKVRPLYDSPLITAGLKSSMFNNLHTNKTISFKPDFCRPVESEKGVDHCMFILFQNRSGSNYLADLISSTGRYNLAGEIFNQEVITHKSAEAGFDTFGAYLDSMKKHAVGGRFACKASLSQFLFLYASSFLDSHFPNRTVVVTQRDDKIAQAISHWIAHHTKQWTSLQAADEKVDVPFDAESLTKIVNIAYDEEKNTRIALSLLGQDYITANYEDFQNFPNFVVRKILQKCGLKNESIDHGRVKLKRQSGPLNSEFRAKYVAHYSKP